MRGSCASKWGGGLDHFGLTPRETETLACICVPLKHSQIARHMGITKHGVDGHWRNIQAKLEARGHIAVVNKVWAFHHQMRMNELRDMLTPKMLPGSAPEKEVSPIK